MDIFYSAWVLKSLMGLPAPKQRQSVFLLYWTSIWNEPYDRNRPSNIRIVEEVILDSPYRLRSNMCLGVKSIIIVINFYIFSWLVLLYHTIHKMDICMPFCIEWLFTLFKLKKKLPKKFEYSIPFTLVEHLFILNGVLLYSGFWEWWSMITLCHFSTIFGVLHLLSQHFCLFSSFSLFLI